MQRQITDAPQTSIVRSSQPHSTGVTQRQRRVSTGALPMQKLLGHRGRIELPRHRQLSSSQPLHISQPPSRHDTTPSVLPSPRQYRLVVLPLRLSVTSHSFCGWSAM